MLVTLITYEKGTQKVMLLEDPSVKLLHVRHEDKEGLTQYPVQYEDGQIVYDHPERLCKYIRPLIEKAFRAKKALEFARKYPGWHSFAKSESDVIHELQEVARVVVYEAGNQFMQA